MPHNIHRIIPLLTAAQQLLQQTVILSRQLPGGLLCAHRVHQRQQPPGAYATGKELADINEDLTGKPHILPTGLPRGDFYSLKQAGKRLLQTSFGQNLPAQALGNQRVHGITAAVPLQPAAVGQCRQGALQRLFLRADSREKG